jgi:hypothetical protein
MRRYKWLAGIALALITVSALMVQLVCSKRPQTLEFELPLGFRGTILVRQDHDHGRAVESLNDHTVVFRVPSDGILSIKEFNSFESPHYLRARFAGGDSLKTSTDVADRGLPKHDETMLYEMGSRQIGIRTPEIVLFVGTADAYSAARVEAGFSASSPFDSPPRPLRPPR